MRCPKARTGSRTAPSSPMPAWRSDRGFTIIEILVSALIVALAAVAVATELIDSATAAGNQRAREIAAGLAQQDQERLKSFSATQLTGLNQSRTVTLNSTPFTVTSTASYVDTSGNSSCSSGQAAYYKTTSVVNWPSNRGTPVEIESDITPPAAGMLLVQTIDQTGAALGGVGVVASGPDYGSGTTSSAGCTLLSDLETGTYTVTFNDSGYVDLNGNTSPTLSATVSGSGMSYTSVHPEQLGLAGTVTAHFTTTATGNTVSCPQSNGTCTSQSADGVTWYGSGTSTSMSADQSSTLSSPGTQVPSSGSLSLFPFYFTGGSYTNNYQMWPGQCAQMQPPSGVDKLTVSPGSSQTASLQEPALDVLVYWNSASSRYSSPVWTRVAPAHVKLSFANSTGPSCSDSWYVPIASDASSDANGSLANLGQPFATTATSGSTASASGYTGTYTVCADYSNYQSSATSVQNNNYTTPTPVTIDINKYSSSFGTC